MAYGFPLTRAQFMDILPIKELTFDLPEAVEISETGGGEVLTASLGHRLWQGEVQLGDMTRDEAADCMAMLDVLRRAGGSFMAHDIGRPGPRADLTGAVLGTASPKLLAVHANNREIRLSGLPIGYQLQRYDYLAFSYGANPVRHALHRIAAPAVAGTGGATGYFEVSPNIRPGFALDADVSLLKASCKAIIVPGTVTPGRRQATMTVGASFKFLQTLR